jgi:hypothetical protein
VKDEEPEIIASRLSGPFTQENISVEVLIYRLETDEEWTLEVVDDQGTSTVWSETFETDKVAHEEFLRTVQAEGIITFLSKPNSTLH